MKILANAFLNNKKALLEAGELSSRTMQNYKETAELVVSQFGKSHLVEDLDQKDFADLRETTTKKWGPVRVWNDIQQTRSAFKYGFDSRPMTTPMQFGPGFTRPSKKTIRLARIMQ